MIAIVLCIGLPACDAASDAKASKPQSLAEFRRAIQAKSVRIQQERNQAIKSCMAKRGFQYVGNDVVSSQDQIEAAEFYGYADVLRNSVGTTSSSGDGSQPVVAPPAGYNLALTGSESGDGSGGCRKEASGISSGDVLGPELQRNLEQTLKTFSSRPAVREAQTKWVDCISPFDPSYRFDQPDTVESYLDVKWIEIAKEYGIAATEMDPVASLRTVDITVANKILDQLSSAEKALWNNDQRCLRDSGVAQLQDELLALVLADIPSDFWKS